MSLIILILINLNKNISFIWRNKDKETSIKTLKNYVISVKKIKENVFISVMISN